MIVPVMAISNLVLTQQIYSEETNSAHAHYREPVPLSTLPSGGNIRKSYAHCSYLQLRAQSYIANNSSLLNQWKV